MSELLEEIDIHKSQEEIKKAYEKSHEHVHRIWNEENRRYVSIDERLRYLLKILSINLPRDLLKKFSLQNEELALTDPPLLVDGVEKTLVALRLKFQMGIISDTGITPGRILRRILDMYNILDFFDTTIFSDEVGFYKPHGIMFDKALTTLGAKPSEAIHIGDIIQTDIRGAKSFGMKTIWLNQKGNSNENPFTPDYEVDNLTDIIAIVNSL